MRHPSQGLGSLATVVGQSPPCDATLLFRVAPDHVTARVQLGPITGFTAVISAQLGETWGHTYHTHAYKSRPLAPFLDSPVAGLLFIHSFLLLSFFLCHSL